MEAARGRAELGPAPAARRAAGAAAGLWPAARAAPP